MPSYDQFAEVMTRRVLLEAIARIVVAIKYSIVLQWLFSYWAPSNLAQAEKNKKKHGKKGGKHKKKCTKKKRKAGKCGNNPKPTPSNGRVRKHISAWTDEEREVLKLVIKLANEAGENGWLKFVRLHHENMPNIHGGPVFTPWHHGAINIMEDYLRTLDSRFKCFPLVLWHRQADRDLILSDAWLGSGNYGPSWKALVFNNGTGQLQPRDGLVRGSSLGQMPTEAAVQSALSYTFYDESPFDRTVRGFRNAIEGWLNGPALHNLIHVGIGGDATVSTSPNDPLFWIIHVYVDYLWWIWKQMNPGSSFEGLNKDAVMPGSPYTPRQMEDDLLGTTYPPGLLSFTAKSALAKIEPKLGGESHSGHASHGQMRSVPLRVGNRGFIPGSQIMDMPDGTVSSMNNFPNQTFANDAALEKAALEAARMGTIVLAEENQVDVFALPYEMAA